MKTKRRTEIKIETHEIKVIRFSKGRSTRFCTKCGKQVTVLSIENAVETMQLALSDLVRLVQTENVHLVQASDSQVLICEDSLGNELAALKKIAKRSS